MKFLIIQNSDFDSLELRIDHFLTAFIYSLFRKMCVRIFWRYVIQNPIKLKLTTSY